MLPAWSVWYDCVAVMVLYVCKVLSSVPTGQSTETLYMRPDLFLGTHVRTLSVHVYFGTYLKLIITKTIMGSLEVL